MFVIVSQSGDVQPQPNPTVSGTQTTIAQRALGSTSSSFQSFVVTGLQNSNPQVDWVNLQTGTILFLPSPPLPPNPTFAYASAAVNMLAPIENTSNPASLASILIAGLTQLNTRLTTDLNSAIGTRTTTLNFITSNSTAVQGAVGLPEYNRITSQLTANTTANNLTLSQLNPSLPQIGPIQQAINDLNSWANT